MQTFKVSRGFIVASIVKQLPVVLLLNLLLVKAVVPVLTILKEAMQNPVIPTLEELELFLATSVFFGTLFALYNIFWCRSFSFIMDAGELHLQGGIFRKFDVASRLEEITDVKVSQDFWGKRFDYADIRFYRPETLDEISFQGIGYRDSMEIREFVFRKIGENLTPAR